MSDRQSLPMHLHTADCFEKTKVLRGRTTTWSPRSWGLLFAALVILVLVLMAPRYVGAAQQYHLPLTVEAGDAARVDMPAEAAVDLTSFLAGFGGVLDPATFQVVEVDTFGAVVDSSVVFQFDASADFDPAANAAGNLVFVLNDSTAAQTTRLYRLLFDVVGGCDDCPKPPPVPVPTTVDSLMYENQMTYLIDTPRADYYYHLAGAGLASVIDNDGQDWISFHDVAGSGATGIYRGIPNLVFTDGSPANSFFHPGFTNATSSLISHGPLKVTVRSITNNSSNEWIVLWEFYQTFARLTVEQVGTSNNGAYWLLYEGTPGGRLDVGDVVVRSDGTITSATDDSGRWQEAIADPQWLYFHDTAGTRYLFLSDDAGDDATDSYRFMGDIGGETAGMTVFGLGRALSNLVPRMSGVGRSFTMGLGEDNATAAAEISGAYRPLLVTPGEPVGDQTSDVDGAVPSGLGLRQNFPNPFNPLTTIRFNLPTSSAVDLSVYDLAGRLTRTLVRENLAAGAHAVVWDGQDQSGRLAASGIYLYRLVTPDHVLHGKMTLLE